MLTTTQVEDDRQLLAAIHRIARRGREHTRRYS
jgi:hypothetical protein